MRLVLALLLAQVLAPGRADAAPSPERLAPPGAVVVHVDASRTAVRPCARAAVARRPEVRRAPVAPTSIYGAGLVALSVVLGAALFNRGFRPGL
jgi:hypothetical protein